MSIIGGSYEFDIFYSYAWGRRQIGDYSVRDWTRRYIAQTEALLKMKLNRTGKSLNCFVDGKSLNNADVINDRIEQAVRRSAVFVAFISRFYKNSFAARELAWFIDQVRMDGSSLQSRLHLIVIQDIGDDEWPDGLSDQRGERRLYQIAHDANGLPLNIAEFLNTGPMPLLSDPVNETVMSLGQKIGNIREDVSARESYDGQRAGMAAKTIFLEAEGADELKWRARRNELDQRHIVVPVAKPEAATEADQGAYAGTDGVVLLHARDDDHILDRLSAAHLRRRAMQSQGKKLKLALLSESGEEPPAAQYFGVDVIAANENWIAELEQRLSRQ